MLGFDIIYMAWMVVFEVVTLQWSTILESTMVILTVLSLHLLLSVLTTAP